MMFKERWFNFRPLSLAFMSILLGSLLSFCFTANIVAFILITISITLVLLTVTIVSKRAMELLIVLTFSLIGVVGYFLVINSFQVPSVVLPEKVEGRIDSITTADTYTSILLTDVSFNDVKQNYNVVCYVDDDFGAFENIEVGNIISFKPYRISKISIFRNGVPNSYVYKNNTKYSLSFNVKTSTKVREDLRLTDIFKARVKSALGNGLSNSNTELAYSSIFGDKSNLDAGTYDSFKLAGVAHLLAVSGLHVGILVLIFSKFLDLIRVKRYYKLSILSLLLLLYCILCGFSPSVVRASIMAIVLLAAKTIYRRYDGLSAISLAGIIVFLINPICLFDVGFLLSFLSVFGIVALYRPFNSVMSKMHLGMAISSSLSITLSVLIAIMFVQFYYFGNINIVTFISNILLIPLFTLAFSVSFVISMIGTIIPNLGIILMPINYLFEFIKMLVAILSKTSLAYIGVINNQFVSLVLYFCILLVMSRFCVAKPKYKMIISSIILAFLIAVLL